MDRDTFSNAQVIALNQKYVFARVDTDKQPQLAQRYKVTGFPTVVAVNANGQEVSRAVGYKSAEGVLEHLPVISSRRAAGA